MSAQCLASSGRLAQSCRADRHIFVVTPCLHDCNTCWLLDAEDSKALPITAMRRSLHVERCAKLAFRLTQTEE